MPKLSPVSPKSLGKILEKKGFVRVRQTGSHARYRHQNGRNTSVPFHSGESVGVGLLRKILKDAGISRKDFEKLR